MDPVAVASPSLGTLMHELISAQSSLNMPTPKTAAGHDVEHAYQHLGEAVRQLQVLIEKPQPAIFQIPEEPQAVGVDFPALLGKLGIDISCNMTQERAWFLDAARRSMENRLLGEFNQTNNTEITRYAMQQSAMRILEGFYHRGQIW